MDIPLLFADARIVVIAKPPGISVHDAPGPGGSLLRTLRDQHGLAGLTPVHRLDKDSSGVLILARSSEVARQFERIWDRAHKTYWALCDRVPPQPAGVIDAPILEHQTGKPQRLRVAVEYFQKTHPGETLPPLPAPKTSAVHPAGRPSRTEYRVLETFGERFCWLEAVPRQGRMHQIRVHLAQVGCPIAVDPLYGQRARLLLSDLRPGAESAVVLARVPLHAAQLCVPDPHNPGAMLSFDAPLPADIAETIALLRDAEEPQMNTDEGRGAD